MIRRRFRLNCDTCHLAEIKLEATTEYGARLEIQISGWEYSEDHMVHACPECLKKKVNPVKDFLDNIDDPI
jgi:hypothetical protein